MADPVTAVGLSAIGAYVAKDTVTKLLGPTAEYLGGELKQFTERKARNIARIFGNATEKAGNKIEEDGAVPPRVLRDIVNDGAFTDDKLTAEYFGGVLASSRTKVARDDRAAPFSSVISRLSTYHIRSHYVFYAVIKNVFNGESLSFGLEAHRTRMGIYMPYGVFIQAMEFSGGESRKFHMILDHTLFGLLRENLIGNFRYGMPDHLRVKNAPEPGITITPSVFGAELFLRVHGIDAETVNSLLLKDTVLSVKQAPHIPQGYRRASD